MSDHHNPTRLRHLISAGALAAAVALAVACGSEGYGDPPGASGSQASIDRVLGPPAPEIWLLVVDDADSAEAAKLRAQVVADVESKAKRLLSRAEHSACAAVTDPSASSAVDWSVVVVHPSRTGDASLTAPADDPGLRWSSGVVTPLGATAFVESVKAALTGTRAASDPYAPLEGLKSAATLLSGQRQAANARESSVLAALPGLEHATVAVMVALSEDDASSSEPEANTVEASSRLVFGSVAVPRPEAVSPEPACAFESAPTTPRLGRWLAAQKPPSWALVPCAGSLIDQLSIDSACPVTCFPFSPFKDEDGTAACVILVETEVAACDASLGWLDPLDDDGVRRPRTTTVSGGATRRVCELRQLEGDALSSCRSDLACAHCEMGWCLTDLSTIPACTSGRPLPLRFVGGVDVVAPAIATITCNFDRG